MTQKHTKLPWVYSKFRDTHDCCIHSKDAIQEKSGYIDLDNGGVVGSSEWIWINDEDAEFICRAVNSHYDLLKAVNLARDIAPTAELREAYDAAIAKTKGAVE